MVDKVLFRIKLKWGYLITSIQRRVIPITTINFITKSLNVYIFFLLIFKVNITGLSIYITLNITFDLILS